MLQFCEDRHRGTLPVSPLPPCGRAQPRVLGLRLAFILTGRNRLQSGTGFTELSKIQVRKQCISMTASNASSPEVLSTTCLVERTHSWDQVGGCGPSRHGKLNTGTVSFNPHGHSLRHPTGTPLEIRENTKKLVFSERVLNSPGPEIPPGLCDCSYVSARHSSPFRGDFAITGHGWHFTFILTQYVSRKQHKKVNLRSSSWEERI